MRIDIATIVIIAANIIISFKGFTDYYFKDRYMFHIGSIQRGEKDRLITSGFLHTDKMHLLFNMLTLYFFNDIVIYHLNRTEFLIVYFASLLLGNLFTLWYYKNNYNYSAVGASGAIMGIVYSGILLQPNLQIYFMPGYIFGILYLGFTIYGIKNGNDGIGHTAHFGGAFGGYLLTLILKPELFTYNPLIVILMAIPIVVLFILIKTKVL